MSHENLFRQLFPIDLDGVSAADFAVEGTRLDVAQTSAEALLTEMFGDTTDALLTDWERVLGLTAGANPEAARKLAVQAKLMERGGLSRAYCIAVAAALGFTVSIHEFSPFTCETPIDQPIYPEEIRFVWRVDVINMAGAAGIEPCFNGLKPAHTAVVSIYALLTDAGQNLATEDGRIIMKEQRR